MQSSVKLPLIEVSFYIEEEDSFIDYHIYPLRWSTISIFSVAIIWNILADYYGSSVTLFVIYLLLVVLFAYSNRFAFTIKNDHLVYQVFFFKKAIIKKAIYPDQVDQIEFILAGWAKKAAVIEVDNGKNVRLAVLQPEEAYDHLLEFAEEQDIPIVKTDDYLSLERKAERKNNKK